jgi:hypothetical protein
MTVMTYTRNAKCKDCVYAEMIYVKLRRKHHCTNRKSKRFDEIITLGQFVCDEWKIVREEENTVNCKGD